MVEIAGSGGISHYTYNLITNYPEPSTIILYTGDPYEFGCFESKFKVKLIFKRFKTNPYKILLFFYDVLVVKPDCVHFQLSQYPSFVLCLSLILKLFKVKIVLTVHNVVSHEEGIATKYILQLLYKISGNIIVHSNFSKKSIITKFALKDSEVIKINHGNYGYLLGNDKSIIPGGIFNILFFGYIRKYKGLDVLLKAISSPQLVDKKFKLIIAGKPIVPFKYYQDLIEKYNIKDKIITRLGYLPLEDVKNLFLDSSVIVLPYKHIDQSGVLHIAYSFSRPVIASSVGGFPEVIEDGYSGYIVPPGDAHALAVAINKLINNRSLLSEFGRNAYHLSITKFSWDNIAIKTKRYYEKLCGK